MLPRDVPRMLPGSVLREQESAGTVVAAKVGIVEGPVPARGTPSKHVAISGGYTPTSDPERTGWESGPVPQDVELTLHIM